MLEWVDWAAEQVDHMADEDPLYQQSLCVQQTLVDGFERIITGLPDKEKDLILDYVDAVIDMEYRKSQLAYQLENRLVKRKGNKNRAHRIIAVRPNSFSTQLSELSI